MAGVVIGLLMAAAGAALSVADGVEVPHDSRVLVMVPGALFVLVALGYWYMTGGELWRAVVAIGVVRLLIAGAIAAMPRGGGMLGGVLWSLVAN